LSLKLLIDEDSQAKLLIRLLRNAGHDLVTISEAFLEGINDDDVLNYARENERVVVTHNVKDFERLHKINDNHPGIIAIYRETNSTKNMSFKAIVKALANLESASISLANQFISLNHWNY
jgi:predicted nuclease of predicted toxin-antitoxin system